MNDTYDGRVIRALVIVVTVDIVIAIVLRAALGAQFVRGDRGVIQALSLVGLLSSVLVAWMLWRVTRGYASLSRNSMQQDAHISAVMATSHEWLWEATPDLVFLACSPSAANVLGYSPEEMIGCSAFDLVNEEFRPAMRAYLLHAIEERTGWSELYARWRHKNGTLVDTMGSAVPVLDERGAVVGFRGARQVVKDVAAESRHSTIRALVRGYIEHDEVAIALQPVLGLRGGRWHNTEALARFPDGRSPDIVIAEAHEVGLGIELELLAVRHALAHLSVLPSDVSLSVNASAEVILDDRFHDALDRPGLDPTRLVLEITEHTAIEDYAELRARLEPLRRRGVRIAVDDTGAGYASFRHVLNLRPDVIKLDRSLLEDVQDNPAARALINAVVMLALELGATVTAEGVESFADVDAVTSLGVHDAQGFYLAPPTTDAIQWAAWSAIDWAAAVGRHASPV